MTPRDRGGSDHLPCVWLRDQWVGLDPTQILGTEPIHPLFGCTSDFGDGVNPFHVWLEELGIRVGRSEPISCLVGGIGNTSWMAR